MKQKKNCNGCRALMYEQDRSGRYFCALGYDNAVNKQINGIVCSMKPKEPCPKPLTNKEFCNLPRKIQQQ